MLPGCCPACVTDLLTLCWAPKCRAEVRPGHVSECVRACMAVLFAGEKAKRNKQEVAHSLRLDLCKVRAARRSPWLRTGCTTSRLLTLRSIINSASQLSASLTSCAQDCRLTEGQKLCETLFFFHGWPVPSDTAASKRLFKETAGCTLGPGLIPHTTLHSSPQTSSR